MVRLVFGPRPRILLAGVLINWLVAAILLSVLAITGLPKILDNQFSIPGDTSEAKQPSEIVDLVKQYPARKCWPEIG